MNRVWPVIVVTGAGTFAMRASFLAVARRLERLPPALKRLLRQIPPAALASIIVPAVVRPAGRLDLTQPRLAATLLAALVAWRTRNVGLTLAVGMAVLVVLESL